MLDVGPIAARALARIVAHLSSETDLPTAPADLVAAYTKLKGQRGAKGVADALGLQEQELSFFDSALKESARRTGDADQRNAVIAHLRFLSWMQTLAQRRPEFPAVEIPASVNEELGRKQIRALELVLRSLIGEEYGTQEALVERLKAWFGEKAVENWRKGADRGDVLSGTTFSELASIFIAREAFDRHGKFYEATPYVTFLRDKRKTIQNFLDDIRRVRNTLAHNRKVTPVDLSLLDLYYEELVSPVQQAHDRGQTRVDPKVLLEVSKEELDGYFKGLREDVVAIKDDLGAIKQATRGLRTGVLAGLAGTAVVIAITVVIVIQNRKTQEDVHQVQKTGEQIAKTTEKTAETTEKIARTLDDVRDGFKTLATAGGILPDAKTPEQHYHNAWVYEQNRDYINARKSYLQFISHDLEFIDPHVRLQSILKMQDGKAGAREVYNELKSRSKSAMAEYAAILLLENPDRIQKLYAYTAAHPDFAPAFYDLSREFSPAVLGEASVAEKKEEKELLEAFFALDQAGKYLKWYLDKGVADAQLTSARERLTALQTLDPSIFANPVTIQAMSSNQGVLVTILISDNVREIFYRLEGEKEFTSTGHQDVRNFLTGYPQPRMQVDLTSVRGPTKIYVKYLDLRGRERGPYEVSLNPANEQVRQAKGVLEMLPSAWVSFRDWDEKQLVYFTHLLSHRIGIGEIRYGVDKEEPDQKFAFSPANPKEPYSINPDDTVYIEVPNSTKFVTVQLTYADGTKSKVQKYLKD